MRNNRIIRVIVNSKASETIGSLGVLLLIIFFWQISVSLFSIPEYLLPSPLAIIDEIAHNYHLLLKHASVTLAEILIGFSLGTVIGFISAVGIVHSVFFEKVVYPLVVFFQTIPKLAIAPLFLVWLGYGILPKIVVVILMSVFPVLINSVSGLQSIDPRLLDLMKILNASKLQILWKIRFFSALPSIFAGLKISITASVIGAVVGEWVGSSSGLGFLILSANSQLNTKLLFSSLTVLSVMGIFMFGILHYLEKFIIYWHQSV